MWHFRAPLNLPQGVVAANPGISIFSIWDCMGVTIVLLSEASWRLNLFCRNNLHRESIGVANEVSGSEGATRYREYEGILGVSGIPAYNEVRWWPRFDESISR